MNGARRLAAGAAFLFCLAFERQPGAQVIRVEGTITYKAYSRENVIAAAAARKFVCRTEGARWSIMVTNAWPETNASALYWETASLGTEVVSLEVRPPGRLQQLLTSARGKVVTPSRLFPDMAIVSPGPVPCCAPAAHLGPVWFAYCSASLSNTVDDLPMKPIWWVAPELLRNTSYLVDAKISRAPEQPFLPERAVFFSDGTAYHPSTGTLSRRSPPYDRGYTNAVFQAENFIRLGGAAIPQRFYLALFRPKPASTTNGQLWIGAEWQGTAESIEIEQGGTIRLPQIVTNTFVHDYRTTTSAGVRRAEYGITNKHWVDIPDPLFKNADAQAKRREEHPGIHSLSTGQARAVIRFSLIGFILVSAVAFIFLLRRSHVGTERLKPKERQSE